MAFVNRSKRDLLNFKSGTNRKVGPGSYLKSDMDLSVGMKYSVAPFCSTSTREKLELRNRDCFHTPGPGAYNASSSASTIIQKKGYSLGRSNRFREGIDDSPGPGNYELLDRSWLKYNKKDNRKKKTKSLKNVEFVKAGTNPSIPTKTNSPTKPPPGPGEYSFDRTPYYRTSKKSGVFRSRTKRNVFKDRKNIPGPGSYFSEDLEVSSPEKLSYEFDYYNNSSVFQSRTKRFRNFLSSSVDQVEGKPGPGSYLSINHSSGFRKKRIPKKYQNFGSSSLRLENKNDNLPGPGHFFKDANNGSSFFHTEIPFGGTSDRFVMKKSVAPGPGKYGPKMSERKKYFNQKTISFQTTAKRFKDVKKDNYFPTGRGGGDFNTVMPGEKKEKGERKRKNIKPMKQKKKYQQRVDSMKKLQSKVSPGPGYYNHVRNDWAPSRRGRSFLSKDKRFKRKEKFIPGPGHYHQPKDFVKMKPRKQIRSNRFIRKESPRKRRLKYRIPGPGSYNVDDIHGWEKKSFNVTLV